MLVTFLRTLQDRWRQSPQSIIVVVALLATLSPPFRAFMLRLHYRMTARKPRLVYKSSRRNEKLLEQCPTLCSPYYAPWYLFNNGHLHTVMLAKFDEATEEPAIAYERQYMDTPDGGLVALDWALHPSEDGSVPARSQVDTSRPTMLLLPGLTGGSSERYIRCTIQELHKLGWQAVVLNSRACENTPVRTPQLFSCAWTDDLRYVTSHLSGTYAFGKENVFMAVGFSMGSNVLVKYLGEEKEKTPLTGAISVGNPFDLVKCNANFRATLFNRLVYDATLTGNLKRLFFEQSNAHEVFQDSSVVNVEAIRSAETIEKFDDNLTAPVFGYPSAQTYYADASSVTRLEKGKIPLLCVSAQDDPISIQESLPSSSDVEANGNVIMAVTHTGGHLGFYQGSKTNGRTCEMWVPSVIGEYAEAVRKDKQ